MKLERQWYSHTTSVGRTMYCTCSTQSRNLRNLKIGVQFPDSENALRNSRLCKFLDCAEHIYEVQEEQWTPDGTKLKCRQLN